METSLAESQTDSYFPTKWPNGYPKQKDVSDTHIQRRTIAKNKPWEKNRLETVSEKYFTWGLYTYIIYIQNINTYKKRIVTIFLEVYGDLHGSNKSNICFTTMEAKDEVWDPVKLVKAPLPSSPVIHYWPFQGGTFIVVLFFHNCYVVFHISLLMFFAS